MTRREAYRLVGMQCLVFCGIGIYWLIKSDFYNASSVLLGGMCCVLPNLYFARRFFRRVGAKFAKEIVKAFYWGEVIKFIWTGSLVILVLKCVSVNMLPFMTGFIGAQFGVWLAPWLGWGRPKNQRVF